MSNIRCIVVEDEPLARRILEDYISRVPFLHLEQAFEDAIFAMDYLRNHSVDLIFLDIHLPRLKGMAFLKTLAQPPAVIVTTAYHQYAVEGYELNVTDYLLKPFSFDRFLSAVNKIKNPSLQVVHPVAEKDHLFVSVQMKKVKILFADILYIESQKEYIKIVTEAKAYITKMGTHEIEELLPAAHFKRIHRSYIVAVQKIRSYTAEEVEVNGIQIPVGRGYRSVLDLL